MAHPFATLHDGRRMRLVQRHQLYCKGRKLTLSGVLPTPPAVIDWSKGNRLDFPILGNDRYADCFYAAACHASQALTGNVGSEDTFDAATVIQYYMRLSGGDNGLDDGRMLGEWTRGLCGGPHKILDYLVVDATNDAALQLGMWLFGGALFTLAIPDAWLGPQTMQPGATWDATSGVRPDPRNGHAVMLSGARGNIYQLQTWGFKPPINLTSRGIRVCQPEAILYFSMDWFDSRGLAPNLMSYDSLAMYWQQLGGHAMPPSPFTPTPAPPTPPAPAPVPPTPTPGFSLITVDAANRIISAGKDWTQKTAA